VLVPRATSAGVIEVTCGTTTCRKKTCSSPVGFAVVSGAAVVNPT
jgi:hypothetical protein